MSSLLIFTRFRSLKHVILRPTTSNCDSESHVSVAQNSVDAPMFFCLNPNIGQHIYQRIKPQVFAFFGIFYDSMPILLIQSNSLLVVALWLSAWKFLLSRTPLVQEMVLRYLGLIGVIICIRVYIYIYIVDKVINILIDTGMLDVQP